MTRLDITARPADFIFLETKKDWTTGIIAVSGMSLFILFFSLLTIF